MAESTGVSDLKGLADFASVLVGSSATASGSGSGTTATTGSTRERQEIDQAAIDKIIQDVLGGAEGLATIFGGEQTAGIFSSTVAAQAAGDLASKLVGEIAKLTSEKVTEQEVAGTTTSEQKQEEEQEGLLKGIFGGLAGILGGAPDLSAFTKIGTGSGGSDDSAA